jgi:hypothetical protein
VKIFDAVHEQGAEKNTEPDARGGKEWEVA